MVALSEKFIQNNKIPVLNHLINVTKVINFSIVISFISIFNINGSGIH